ncbi:MAG: molybdopterin-dependent oxidoreductase [Actinomycetota bacterium]|nr:molybdopterin-dependent oxidoreductase [Actinomycetota bacterium]
MTTRGLPPGQRAQEWRRFGLPEFARREVRPEAEPCVHVGGAVRRPTTVRVDDLLASAARVVARSDLHCVMTWSALDLDWGGVPFAPVVRALTDLVEPDPATRWLELTGLDGYRACLSLEDASMPDVLLADEVAGRPLTPAQGAPLRLVAPSHYGYMQVKQLCRIDFLDQYRPGSAGWKAHPRGRVALEERSRGLPGVVWRYGWRALLPLARRPYDRSGSDR